MAKKSRPLIWLEFLAARTLIGSLSLMPRRAAIASAVFIAGLAYHVFGGLRRVASVNLNIAFPNLEKGEKERLAKGAFRNLGRILGELSQFPKATRENINAPIDFQIDPDVYAEYLRLKSEGRGIIIVSPHLGNWEMLVFGWAVYDAPMSYLARPLDNPKLEDLTVRLRTKFGNRPINKTNSAIQAARILREEGLLGILADVNAHPKEGVFVPFFGVQACTSTGPALLAIRTNSAIVPMCAVWDDQKQRYTSIHGPLIHPPSSGDRRRDVHELTAAFTAEVEKLVRRFPDQWLWIHKRWKTRPPGEKDLYANV